MNELRKLLLPWREKAEEGSRFSWSICDASVKIFHYPDYFRAWAQYDIFISVATPCAWTDWLWRSFIESDGFVPLYGTAWWCDSELRMVYAHCPVAARRNNRVRDLWRRRLWVWSFSVKKEERKYGSMEGWKGGREKGRKKGRKEGWEGGREGGR